MKKLFLAIIFNIIIITLFADIKVYADNSSEKVLMKYTSPTTPVTYFNTDIPVTIPTTIDYNLYQFRGIYVFTEDNIDIKQQTTIEQFKKQYINILDTIEEYNMNTIIFQVRPMNDAFYDSKLNPWSEFLIGEQGKDPGWDPLKWMITETHNRNIQFYAGFNAYRVSSLTTLTKEDYISTLSPNNFAFKHPDYVMTTTPNSDNKIELFLNPGIEEVQQFIIDSVVEIIENYDVDAINFEDYFYPKNNLNDFQDKTQYKNESSDNISLPQWRRENINDLFKNLKNEVEYYNLKNDKVVQIGVSPSGIWGNYSENNKLGSNTLGDSSYSIQYADTKLWVNKGYIDYIAPQIKWEFDNVYTPYADVVDWWANVVKDSNVNLYIGQYLKNYNINDNWENPQEIPNQLKYNQKYSKIKGTLFFNYHSLIETDNIPLEMGRNIIKNSFWTYRALLPCIPNVDNTPPNSVRNLFVKYENNSVRLQWKNSQEAKAYIVYRFDNGENVNLDDHSHIIRILNNTSEDKILIIDSNVTKNNIYQYFIIAIDHANNQSMPVIFGIDLSPNENFKIEMIIFSIVSIISLSIISYTGYRTLKNN